MKNVLVLSAILILGGAGWLMRQHQDISQKYKDGQQRLKDINLLLQEKENDLKEVESKEKSAADRDLRLAQQIEEQKEQLNQSIMNIDKEIRDLIELHRYELNQITEGNQTFPICSYLIKTANDAETSGKPLPQRVKDTITLFINAGADLNARGNKGLTPLMYVANKSTVEACKVLIEGGADINARNDNGATVLMSVVPNPRVEVCKLLIKAGADVNAKANGGFTPLMNAAYNSKIDVSKELIEAGADVNAENKDHFSVLMHAVCFSTAEMCELLIKAGAEVNTQDNDGSTPLMHAVRKDNEEVVRLLLNEGADANRVDKKGRKAINYAKSNAVKELLQRSSQQDTDESYSLTTEGEGGYSNAGVQVEEDRSGLDPLIANMRALRCREATSQLYQKRLLTLLPLIRNGADVNVTLTETKGNTALHYACGIGSWSITLWLVEHGADVNAVTNAGKTPLDCVGEDNAKRIRELLISRGAKRSSELSASSYTYSAGNDAEELNNLGLAYQYGNNGKPQNYSEAARHFRLAAEQGHAGAQNNLGFCYHNGWGVPKDMSQAAMWYKRSADQGNAWGQSNYGTCLEFGWGVRKNVSAAIEMYRRAAAQGHASAKKHLKRHGITM